MKPRTLIAVSFIAFTVVFLLPAFAEEGKPDLLVEDMWFSTDQPLVEESIRVAASVMNRGDANASKGFSGEFYLNGRKSLVLPFKQDFPPDHGSIASMDFTPHLPGNYTIYFEVDPENLVDESDEENNSYTVTIYVSELEPETNETVNGTVTEELPWDEFISESLETSYPSLPYEVRRDFITEERIMIVGAVLAALLVTAVGWRVFAWKKRKSRGVKL